MRKNEKITALYERLSRDDFGKDDDQQRESNSISNQKAMLEEFAARQGFTNIVHFTDEHVIIGTSGENLVKSRGSALVPFSFLLRDKPKSFKSLKIINERL